MHKWNGCVCGAGFCCLVAGSALMGVGFTPAIKFKVDPKCDDKIQECERYVYSSDRDNKYYCKIFGIIFFTLGTLLSAIDLGSCIKQWRKGNLDEDLDDRSWHDMEGPEERPIQGPEADRFLEISNRRREAVRNHRVMQRPATEDTEVRRPIYSSTSIYDRAQDPDLAWRQSNREPSLAERSNMRSEAARNSYLRSSGAAPRTNQTTQSTATAISSTRPTAPSTRPAAPSAPSAPLIAPRTASSSRNSTTRRSQPSRYNDQPPGYDQIIHPPTYWEALEAQGHFEEGGGTNNHSEDDELNEGQESV